MYRIYNLLGSKEDSNIINEEHDGPFTIVAHKENLTTKYDGAQAAYFAGLLKHWRRQLICSLSKADVIIRAGRMQWMVGDVEMRSGVSGISNFIARSVKAKLVKQTAVHPEFTGTGLVVLEPTMKNMKIVDLSDWEGAIVLGECTFAAVESTIKISTISRTNLSSAMMGNEGLFNYCLQGEGKAVLEFDPPYQELVEVALEDDVLRIDGHFALAWSQGLRFTVEPAGVSLMGSALSQEGMVNVYSGTGRILLAPLLGLKPGPEKKESK